MFAKRTKGQEGKIHFHRALVNGTRVTDNLKRLWSADKITCTLYVFPEGGEKIIDDSARNLMMPGSHSDVASRCRAENYSIHMWIMTEWPLTQFMYAGRHLLYHFRTSSPEKSLFPGESGMASGRTTRDDERNEL